MTPENGYVLLRWGFFASLMLTTGVASTVGHLASRAFSCYLAERLRPALPWLTGLTLFMAGAILVVQHVMMSGDVRQLTQMTVWRAVLNTTAGSGWALQTGLALVATMTLWVRGVAAFRVWLALSLLQWCGMALIGHAASQEGMLGIVQRITHVIHVTSAALWVGGLPPLLLLMVESRRERWRSDASVVMLRFSYYGHIWVGLTVVTGGISVWQIVGWPAAVGPYSLLLLIKIGVVALMVALALYNRYRLVPRLRGASGDAAWHQLRVNIWLGIGLSAAVLALVSLFATLSPYVA